MCVLTQMLHSEDQMTDFISKVRGFLGFETCFMALSYDWCWLVGFVRHFILMVKVRGWSMCVLPGWDITNCPRKRASVLKLTTRRPSSFIRMLVGYMAPARRQNKLIVRVTEAPAAG